MSAPTKTFHGRKTLSGWISHPLKKIQRKRGFAESRLLTDWDMIVGKALAQHCAPQKLSFPKDQHGATLHIICTSGWATELQFQSEVICDKIATFFGYRAVGAIRIHQGPLPSSCGKPKVLAQDLVTDSVQSLSGSQNDQLIKDVQDDELRNSLLRLGLSLEASKKAAMKDETQET
jgi:hypothetical protein